MKNIILAVLVLFGLLAIADEIPAPPASAAAEFLPTPTVASQPVIVEKLDQADKSLPAQIPAWGLAIAGVAAEILVRVVPTSKPRSILLVLSHALGLIGSIFSKLSALLDQVLQNVKDDPK